MKGIILAGGTGTRLYPLTQALCKQLLPVYDKPLIYYPLSVLMLAKIKDILIICRDIDYHIFNNLFADGSYLGLNIEYAIQDNPEGIAQAFTIGKYFLGRDDVCLILGDNIFYGDNFTNLLQRCVSSVKDDKNAIIFGYGVSDPHRYGIVSFDNNNNVISIEEKPSEPKSNYAVVGLYFYPNDVVNKAFCVTPSERGELEITSINSMYLDENNLKVELLGRGFAWLDAGTHDSLLDAGKFVQTIEARQGYKIACIEEIAFNNNWISKQQLLDIADYLSKSKYGIYLKKLVTG